METEQYAAQSGILYYQIKLLGVGWKRNVNAKMVAKITLNLVLC
jgi:hypothetical protein